MNNRLPWKRIVVEGAVIVGSILLAFGIDAWWQGQKEADREQRVLEALLVEFEQNDRLLGEARTEYQSRYTEAIRLLELLDLPPDESDGSEVGGLLRGLVSGRTFHLESGAHDALLASGELDLIQDESLRNRLAAWPSYVAEWTEEEVAIFSYIQDVVAPHLSTHLRLRDVSRTLPAFPDGEPPPQVPPTSAPPTSLAGLRGSLEFDNLVFRRAQGAWHAMRDGETLRAQASMIIESIRQNLRR